MRKSKFGITLVVALLAACFTFASTEQKKAVTDCFESGTVNPAVPPSGGQHTKSYPSPINSTPVGDSPASCSGTRDFCCYLWNAAHTQITAVVYQD